MYQFLDKCSDLHANLRNSSGLTAQKRKYIDIGQAPDRVKAVYERVLPHYEHMHRHRLGATVTAPAS